MIFATINVVKNWDLSQVAEFNLIYYYDITLTWNRVCIKQKA